ncbi:MAG TPA: pyridoxamine 5'-phosphate oxidase family protein [Treponemataceae bacterium]|nr:pyridoxamine 5'-phosphate oxidase family protein [Treponemataceae bacterium]HPS44843.1 pyridoxamine 5'-phosphate oxidase family protein [Treponemataceae bacterium]
MNEGAYKDALALTLREGLVSVSSLDETGYPETRAMFNLLKVRAEALSTGPARADRDFATYLATNTGSRKVPLMRKDGRVCLYYCDGPAFEGCSVRGQVSEVFDKAIRSSIWVPDWEMYYRGGMDGGDFTVLRFVPERVRYYHGLAVEEFVL